jgi:hypothetical protein
MGESLHARFPAIGRALHITPTALYGLQVHYLRAGLIDVVKGRGPGSGVQASGRTLAQFVIALATNASIKDNVRDAKAVAKARSVDENGERPCPLTLASTFIDALATVLANSALAERVSEVLIGASFGQAFIRYDGAKWQEGPGGREYVSSVFGTVVPERGVHFQASIPGDTLMALAKALR